MDSRLYLTGVYCIRNTVNDKRYVGSAARTFEHRWRKHRNELASGTHHSILLQRAWNKHGKAAFVFEYLEFCDAADCVDREQWWMDHYGSANPQFGYNVSPLAGSQLGVKFSDRARQNMSAAHARSEKRRAHLANLCKKNRGAKRPPETGAKISAALRGKKKSAEHIQKMKEQTHRQMQSPELKEKIRAANRRREWTPAEREKMKRRQLEEAYRRFENGEPNFVRFLTIDGESHPVRIWSQKSGTPDFTINKRLRNGMSVRDAVYAPTK